MTGHLRFDIVSNLVVMLDLANTFLERLNDWLSRGINAYIFLGALVILGVGCFCFIMHLANKADENIGGGTWHTGLW